MKIQIMETEEYRQERDTLDDFLIKHKIKHEAASVKEWQTEQCDGECLSDPEDSDLACEGHEYSFHVIEWEFDYDKLSKAKKLKLDKQLKLLEGVVYAD